MSTEAHVASPAEVIKQHLIDPADPLFSVLGADAAKRDLKAGEVLDDYGMYMTYGEAVNVHEMSEKRYLPEGLVEGCKLTRNINKDGVITYDDVELPPNRLADRLRAEQYRHFRGETWLEERIGVLV